MPSSSWRDLSLAACKKARIYFSQELVESMNFDPEVDGPEHLGIYLMHKVLTCSCDDLVRKYYGKNLSLLFVTLS